jgi:hypothetical protein
MEDITRRREDMTLILFYFILLSFHCTKYIYYMYNEASLQQVHIPNKVNCQKTIVSYID